MKRSIKLLVASFLAGAAMLGANSGVARAESATASTTSLRKDGFCVRVQLPVALAQGQPFDQHIGGTYCQPFAWTQGAHQVDLLTEGATYNRTYWDWPQQPMTYSYVNKTLAAGRATFYYDRLGTGSSSHPVSTDITIAADAFVLHELVQGLYLLGYHTVNSIGHSYGSGIVLREAGTFKDVSRVVLTGYLHASSNPIVTAGIYPANQDPAFAGQNLDNGYLTTRPGVRGTNFYSSSADPSIVAYDETHKDLVAQAGFVGFLTDRAVAAGSNLSNQINVPVLSLAGQQDFIFCYSGGTLTCANEASVKANEAPYFTGTPSFDLHTIANTGHDLTLHPSAGQSFQMINQWISTH